MSFTNASYFIGDLNIPNTDETAILSRINWTIQKYEPIFFEKLLGYPLYKAFIAGMSVVAPAVPEQRYLNILYGCEYTNLRGYLAKWKGLIETNNPLYNLAGSQVYKAPVYVKAGVTPGFTPGDDSATLDGTAGTDDWRGWIPVITRAGVMVPGTDYSWDPVTGILQLLIDHDEFGDNELFFTSFQLRSDNVPSPDLSMNLSVIANFIYYWYCRTTATQSTGIGEVRTMAENAVLDSPNQKMANAWNQLSDRVREFIMFMDTMNAQSPSVYPEWQWIHRYDTYREFEFVNPIF